MEAKSLNGVMTFAPTSRQELISMLLIIKRLWSPLMQKRFYMPLMKAEALINRNMGYPDGIGAVWALRKKGAKQVVKIPGCELWLDVIKNYYKSKSFYLVGGKAGDD